MKSTDSLLQLEALINRGEEMGTECFWGPNTGQPLTQLPLIKEKRFLDFLTDYRNWYWPAKVILTQIAPQKLTHFKNCLEAPRNRTGLTFWQYCIEDWIEELRSGTRFDIANETSLAANQFRTQIAILEAARELLLRQIPHSGSSVSVQVPKEQTKASVEQNGAVSFERCSDLATNPDISGEFGKQIVDAGLAGELNNAKLLALVLTSRLLDKPVSCLVKGPPSAGKNKLIELVSKFFPEESYLDITAMGEDYLAYCQEDLRHRTIILGEYFGMTSKQASYLMRSLLSSQKIVSRGHTRSGDKTVTVEGPINLISTTTRVSVDLDMETRCLTISVDDSPEQTKRVLAKMAEPPKQVDFSKWISLQQWLATLNSDVHIPFKKELMENIKPVALRTRRDAQAIVSLIQAHALLHAGSRKIMEDGRIVATLDDYRAVYSLAARLVTEAAEVSISQEIRDVVDVVLKYCEEQTVDLSLIAGQLNIDRSTASRRVSKAIELDYLVNRQGRKGRPGDYFPNYMMPEDDNILPSPEELDELIKNRKEGSST